MSRLSEMVRGVLQVDPAAPAMEHEGRWRSWGELERLVSAMDETLTAAGLGEGVRVAAMLRNHPLTAAALLSLVTTDRCVVTLNPTLPDARLASETLDIARTIVSVS